MTIVNLIEYVEKNKKGNAFKNWSYDDYINWMHKGIDEESMFVSVTNDQEINGIVIAEQRDDNKVFVKAMLTTGKGAFEKLIKALNRRFPISLFYAERRGKVRAYDTIKFLKHI